MTFKHVWIFAAIIGGNAAVATGTWLLTRGPQPLVAESTEPEVPAPTVVVPAPAVAVPAPAAPAQPPARELRRLGAEHAGTALAAWHGTFVEKCWNPSVAKVAAPEQIALRFNLSFDPTGSLVGLGISDNRRAYRSDVSACLRGLGVKLKIPGTGAPLQVEVPLTLP